MDDKELAKIELAIRSNTLGKHRLTAAIVQALLTSVNLVISVVILMHVIV